MTALHNSFATFEIWEPVTEYIYVYFKEISPSKINPLGKKVKFTQCFKHTRR